jgi:hypothetical protein
MKWAEHRPDVNKVKCGCAPAGCNRGAGKALCGGIGSASAGADSSRAAEVCVVDAHVRLRPTYSNTSTKLVGTHAKPR